VTESLLKQEKKTGVELMKELERVKRMAEEKM